MKSVSYCITVCNEHKELDRLINQLLLKRRDCDEIVVQMDTTATPEVRSILENKNHPKFKVIEFGLNGDFAAFKNNSKNNASGDYYFCIDADEYLSDVLVLNIGEVVDMNPDIYIYAVPRINTVSGLTQEHINQWRWRVDEKGWINYPDYQTRICKNIPEIQWVGKVHERLVGPQGMNYTMALPEGFELIHPKDIKRQEKQNRYYETI